MCSQVHTDLYQWTHTVNLWELFSRDTVRVPAGSSAVSSSPSYRRPKLWASSELSAYSEVIFVPLLSQKPHSHGSLHTIHLKNVSVFGATLASSHPKICVPNSLILGLTSAVPLPLLQPDRWIWNVSSSLFSQLVAIFSYFRLTSLIPLLCWNQDYRSGALKGERVCQVADWRAAFPGPLKPETLSCHPHFGPSQSIWLMEFGPLHCQSHLECSFLINKSTFKL